MGNECAAQAKSVSTARMLYREKKLAFQSEISYDFITSNRTGMLSKIMKSKRRTQKIYKQMLDTAAAEYDRTGRLPPLRIRKHMGTGVQTISSLPDDCEDGMRRTVRRLPRR
jgi:hypothetical protein